MPQEAPAEISALVRRCFGSSTGIDRFEPLAGDASTRRYARAWLKGGAAPPSAVVMMLADRGVAMSSEELAVFDEQPNELPYVNVHNFLSRVGVAVPELYADASAAGLLLLEDVGDITLWDAVQGQEDTEVERLFALAIDQLLTLQIDGMARRDVGCIAFQQAFDERLFLWEFEHFIEHGLTGCVPRGVPDDDLAILRRHFKAISGFLDRQPRVLNHRDFHAWNLFVHDGRIRVIDFQDALLAPAPYDLATLLGDRVTPEVISPSIERRLLTRYAQQSAAHGGPSWDANELWELYSALALQKAFKVVGRFHYLDRVKGKPGYLRYIRPTLRQIRRLLDERPDLAPVGEILSRYASEIEPCAP